MTWVQRIATTTIGQLVQTVLIYGGIGLGLYLAYSLGFSHGSSVNAAPVVVSAPSSGGFFSSLGSLFSTSPQVQSGPRPVAGLGLKRYSVLVRSFVVIDEAKRFKGRLATQRILAEVYTYGLSLIHI